MTLEEALAMLDGKLHRHVEGAVCIACIPEEIKKLLAAEVSLAEARAELVSERQDFKTRSHDYHDSLRVAAVERDNARADLRAEQERHRQ